MYKKRVFIEGAYYHVTSRTNNKVRVFETRLGRKIMLLSLQEAKEKFNFRLTNFCVMPTHIHLLIQPKDGTNLSEIMQILKCNAAKRWNVINNSKDHLWGQRFFSRVIKDQYDYDAVMEYINLNPVKDGLVEKPEEWDASGAFQIAEDLPDLVDK